MKKRNSIVVICLAVLAFAGCSNQKKLPASSPDPTSMFGVEKKINMETIDNYLNRSDVVYRDMRMLFDPADYGAIGGNADLSATIEGFKIVPYPYLATLTELPVKGAYSGDALFSLTWDSDGKIATATPNYDESMLVLEDLFPKDKPIFLMCGGGGYAGMTKALLIKLGWDEKNLYNIGGNWSYKGKHAYELIKYAENPNDHNIFATWRADYAYIDFSRLHKK
ncbi:MAG: rhodanese-like domain-containing protein [Treponema sp.]|nr:rhodanese-like domain-containing protein [Treponema sp.]